MTDFSNSTIDTLQLPQYEDAELMPIHPSYMNVIWVNIAITYIIVALAAGAAFYFIEETREFWLHSVIGYGVLLVLTIIIQVINYRNKGFAFREHDVIYRSGAISLTTTIIPYSRVQHVAEHEGVVSRWLGLSSIEIFTAGGTGSDIRIPGLEKVHALAVKQLLVGKIEKDTEEKEEADLYTQATESLHNDEPNHHADEA
jgi:membrane protein YdbS with pleckstrin-like domain